LSSAAGTDARTGCINTPVTNITYSTTGATGATVTGLPAGVTGVWAANVFTISGTPTESGIFSYVVTLEGSCGVVSASGVITVNPSPAISGTQTNVACFGGSSGAVNLTISGGSEPYTFLWSNGATTEDLSGLIEGTYSVTVTDINGCTANASFTITQPAQLTGNVSSKTNVLCFGASSGSITFAGSGGTSPYEYSIDAGPYQPLGTFNDLDAGLHTMSVRDANLCTFNVAVNISQPATALSGSVESQTYVSVPGGNDGSVTVAAAGGTSPYQYKLDAGAYQASGTFGSLMAGSYIVTIQDINLCTFDVPVTITQPTVLLAGSITSQTNVSCSGTPTGSVTVSATGGLAPYEYRIEAGSYQSSPAFGSLAAGNYTITIRDAALNTVEVNVTITGPSEPLGVLLTTQTNILCFGTNSGSATVTGSGGITPYQYKLSTGSFQVSGTFSSLTAGTYTITVEDANLCTADVVVTLTQPAADLTGTIAIQTDVTCSGSDDGAITITAAGGTSPYEFSLDGEQFQSSGIFINLTASTYNITIRDANLCTTVVSTTITAPVDMLLDYKKVKDAQCPGSTDGIVSLSITGGRPPYRVIWSDNSTLLIRTNLPGGTYSVIATDFNGCAASLNNIVVRIIGTATCLEISEIITPNDDGFNDTWKMKNIDLFPDAEVFVYNRWGELVFRTKNISANEWDGTFKGKLLPTDSYHYILHLNDGSEPRSGVISIIR
jgi:gliding motility-associated-like protein